MNLSLLSLNQDFPLLRREGLKAWPAGPVLANKRTPKGVARDYLRNRVAIVNALRAPMRDRIYADATLTSVLCVRRALDTSGRGQVGSLQWLSIIGGPKYRQSPCYLSMRFKDSSIFFA